MPGTKFDQIVVLEGEQGTGKSTVIKILASEDYFSDAEILGLGGREVQELCTGVLLYEIGELEGLGKRDVAHVKAFAVRTHDRARPAYGHMLENRGRACIFIGTTNSSDYLADDTGNRRFWPVVTHPRPGQVELELAALRRDRDQLWAEAVVAERTGESLVIDKELWGEAAAVVDARLPDDPWQDILATVENMPNSGGSLERAEGYIKVTSEFLLNGVLCISPEKVNQNHSKRLARVMERLGWEKPPNIRIGTRVGKGYVRIIK
jgi:predicted P-loop ATPase